MRDRSEPFDRLAADPLCRAVGRDQLWMFAFDRPQFFHQSIEFAVGDLRSSVHVIEAVVVVDFAATIQRCAWRVMTWSMARFSRDARPAERSVTCNALRSADSASRLDLVLWFTRPSSA